MINDNWGEVFRENCPNRVWDLVKEKITSHIDELCSYGWKKIVKGKPIWYDSTLSEIAKHRDRLFRNYRRGGGKNKETLNKAILKRREFDKACKLAKNNFYKDQLSLYYKDQRKFWSIIKELTGNMQNRNIDTVFEFGTETLLGKRESVEEINKFFAGVGERVTSEIESVKFVQLDKKPTNENLSSFQIMTISKFLKIVKGLKCSKSSGITGINSRVMICSMVAVPSVFVHLCNMSLQSGIFPDEFKIARISIIPKKGDTRLLDNLRPISLLNIVSKVMEKFVKQEIVDYMENNQLFYPLQFGFRASRSIHDALFCL